MGFRLSNILFGSIAIVIFTLNGPPAALGLEYFFKQEINMRANVDLNDEGGGEDVSFGRIIVKPEVEVSQGDSIEAKASLKADYIYAKNSSNDMDQKEIRLWESYVLLKRPRFWLSVGNLLVRWGKADEFSPLDNINTQDLRELIFVDMEGRKRPVPLAHLKVFKGGGTLEFVFSPRLNHHKRDFFNTDWAVFRHYVDDFKGLHRLYRQDATYSLKDSEMGLRWSFRVRDVDLGVSIFYGHDRSPYPALRPPTGLDLHYDTLSSQDGLRLLKGLSPFLPPGLAMRVEYPRDTVMGIEFETVVGNYGLRGEAAYHTGRVFLREDLFYFQKEYYQYVIGVDRFFDNDLYLNLQFYQQIIGSYSDSILFDPEVDSGLTAKVSWPFADERFELSLTGFYSLANEMWYVNPEIRWKPRDNVYLFMGIHSIYGDDGSYFDLYDENSDFYFGLNLIL